MAGERRKLWLGVLLIAAIIAAIVVWSMDGTATPATRRAAQGPRAAARTGDGEAQQPPAHVNLEALERPRGEPGNEGRDPFRFRPKPPPPPPPVAEVVERPGGAQAGVIAPSVPQGPAAPPPIALKFIGLVVKADGTRIAVLSDGKRPYHGVEGQELEGQYRILKIGVESLEIAYLDGRGRQTIKLTGQ